VPVISRIDGLQGEDNLKNYLNKEKRSVMDAEVSLLVINYEAALMKFFSSGEGLRAGKNSSRTDARNQSQFNKGETIAAQLFTQSKLNMKRAK
jgi:hypothetical protein